MMVYKTSKLISKLIKFQNIILKIDRKKWVWVIFAQKSQKIYINDSF